MPIGITAAMVTLNEQVAGLLGLSATAVGWHRRRRYTHA